MAADPYEVLGLPRTATAEDIRRAYRKLAKQNHPDLNPGNKAAEERFKAINSANDLLSDPDRRARFDRGEIDAAGDPRAEAPPRGGGYAAPPGFEAADFDDVFADLLRPGAARRPAGPRRGRDRSYSLDVAFLDAVNGGVQRLTLPDGTPLDVRIPPGVEHGQVLRVREKGDPGRNGGPPGDALIEVFVRPHALFKREGNDITVELPVSLTEAVLGAKVPVPTPSGTVTLTIPPHSANGAKLRLRGRGVGPRPGREAGDLYVQLRLVLDPADEALAAFLRTHESRFDPRRDWP